MDNLVKAVVTIIVLVLLVLIVGPRHGILGFQKSEKTETHQPKEAPEKPTAAPSPQAKPKGPRFPTWGMSENRKVPFYSSRTSQRIVGYIEPNREVKVLGREHGWTEIHHNGFTGWVRGGITLPSEEKN